MKVELKSLVSFNWKLFLKRLVEAAPAVSVQQNLNQLILAGKMPPSKLAVVGPLPYCILKSPMSHRLRRRQRSIEICDRSIGISPVALVLSAIAGAGWRHTEWDKLDPRIHET